MERRVYLTPNNAEFNPAAPKLTDFENALDLTGYMTTDGVTFAAQQFVKLTGGDVEDLAAALRKFGEAANTSRTPEPVIGNTSKRYPTSRPPWARRK